MRIELLNEPQLEFSEAKRHIDIRFGLTNHGPLDAGTDAAPTRIHVGLVGTAETIEGARGWFERCRHGIPMKAKNRQPNLFTAFPGFTSGGCFGAELVFGDELEREVKLREIRLLAARGGVNEIVAAAVELFLVEMRALADKGKARVMLCAPPLELLEIVENAAPDAATAEGNQREPREDEDRDGGEAHRAVLDFRDLLKAKAMPLRIPIQIVLPATYNEKAKRRQAELADRGRKLQDEATRAWNLHTALYYKAGGYPWRLPRIASELATCFLGVAFFDNLDGSMLSTSIAQVFNERGDGVVVRGATAAISKDDRQPHLHEADAKTLVNDALRRYREEHKNFPARVVIHKSSSFTAEELAGFRVGIEQLGIDSADFVTIGRSGTRLFRHGSYPPLRGTYWQLDERESVLYTRGSVPFFSTYPGMYIPRPLSIRCIDSEQTPRFIASEILALTKLNWNNTQFDQRDPITVRAAREVGRILKHVGEQETVEPKYAYYM